MELYDEDMFKVKKKTETKGTKILLIIIILLVLLCITIVCLIIYLKDSIITVTIDGGVNNKFRDIIVFEENNSKIYVPVRKLAEILEYESYNGEYLNKSEDTTKCYVESKNEVVNLELNSNYITKKELKNNSAYEKIELEEPIKEINGDLCANIDGIEKIFNVDFSYSVENKKITLFTLSYLVDYYVKNRLPSYDYIELKEGFTNQKAILNNILIAKNSNGKYGVIQTNGETILEPKYDNIEYLKNTNEFLVTSNEKKGIISYDKKIKVDIEYEEINEINENLYIVSKNDNIGIITKTGETVIYPKYDYIGLENNVFEENKTNGNYIFLENLIPIKENKKLAIYKLENMQVATPITEFIYDGLGCIINSDKEKESVLFIEDYEVFIAQKDKKYYILKKDGTRAIEYGFDSIYKIDNEGKTEYYMTYNNGKVENVIQWLEKIGIERKK